MARKSEILDYSVVVPVYNEEGNIANLDREIKEVMSKLSKNYEVIYVNDGSRDRSLHILRNLKNVKIINLNRNYGQSTALDAGFKASRGEIVISLDGDGQNDPQDIPILLKKLKEKNLDVVAGWRRKRQDPLGIRILTRMGRFFRRIIIDDIVHDTGCTLRVYKSEAVKTLDLQGEMHRYILALLRWKGFRIGEEIVHHRPRIEGQTKYGHGKAIRGFIDLMYIWFIDKYSQRPLHMFGYVSAFSFLLGALSLGESIFARLVWGLSLNRNGYFFLGFFLLIIAGMTFAFGIITDLLIRTHLNTSPHERRYYIREIIEN